MTVQVGFHGFDLEDPTDVHECGPSGPCIIEDALSRARGHYLAGVDILWIWNAFHLGLEEMIRMHYWRSPDAADFYFLLRRQVVQKYMIPLEILSAVAAPQSL